MAELVIADAQSKSSNAKVRYQWERHSWPCILRALALPSSPRNHHRGCGRRAQRRMARETGGRAQALSCDPACI
jgi:hypothetical protein